LPLHAWADADPRKKSLPPLREIKRLGKRQRKPGLLPTGRLDGWAIMPAGRVMGGLCFAAIFLSSQKVNKSVLRE